MKLQDYVQFDACGLADGMRAGDFSADEVRRTAREAIEAVNDRLNAVVECFDDRFETGDHEANPGGALAGVPFMLKDAGATEAGRLQEKGSRLLKGARPTVSSFFTRQCKAAGLVNLGRTTTPEAALSGTTESLATGATRNPYDLSLSTSGSSGGAAALVAAGALPIAHGNDGAGSIRMPASVCGLVGLKPSRGRVSAGPIVDEIALGAAAEFFLARSMRDVAAGLDAVARPQCGDPFRIAGEEDDWSRHLGAPVKGLKVGFTTTNWKTGAPVAEPVSAAVLRTVKAMEALGCDVEAVEPVFDKDLAYRVNAFCFDSLTLSYAAYARRIGVGFDDEHVEPAVRLGFERISAMSAEDCFGMIGAANTVRRQIGDFFERFDLLVTPATPTTRVPLGTLNACAFDDIQAFRDANEALQFAFTCPFNITGQPAISLPLATDSEGFPIGVQLVARVSDEASLLRVGAALEQAMPWAARRPPVYAGTGS